MAGDVDGGLMGYSVEELRAAVQEGVESGTSEFGSMAEIIAEARRTFEKRLGGDAL